MSEYVANALLEARSKVKADVRTRLETVTAKYQEELTDFETRIKKLISRLYDPEERMKELHGIAEALLDSTKEIIADYDKEMKEIAVWETAVKAGKRITAAVQ